MKVCYKLINRELQILLKLCFLEDVSADLAQTLVQASAPPPQSQVPLVVLWERLLLASTQNPCLAGAGPRQSGSRWVTDIARLLKYWHPLLQLGHVHPSSMGY